MKIKTKNKKEQTRTERSPKSFDYHYQVRMRERESRGKQQSPMRRSPMVVGCSGGWGNAREMLGFPRYQGFVYLAFGDLGGGVCIW